MKGEKERNTRKIWREKKIDREREKKRGKWEKETDGMKSGTRNENEIVGGERESKNEERTKRQTERYLYK